MTSDVQKLIFFLNSKTVDFRYFMLLRLNSCQVNFLTNWKKVYILN